ncbi:hypothetical protein CLCR_07840 [Cladophialophora carrionii]|uniref:Uncharacterized protein n=1 Tax=Cladophialophora carrionii TaxID=86049 RepID=A0A1C1CNB4_9EURO|nr:hypothetical protein CLCR_07840 [Cladophialophora carrionii]
MSYEMTGSQVVVAGEESNAAEDLSRLSFQTMNHRLRDLQSLMAESKLTSTIYNPITACAKSPEPRELEIYLSIRACIG